MRSPAPNRRPINLYQGSTMLRDLALAAKAACSREDQESLVPLVKDLRDLGEVACKRGLLALEGELKIGRAHV